MGRIETSLPEVPMDIHKYTENFLQKGEIVKTDSNRWHIDRGLIFCRLTLLMYVIVALLNAPVY